MPRNGPRGTPRDGPRPGLPVGPRHPVREQGPVPGKRTLSERIVYTALETVPGQTGGDPVSILKKAVENTRPGSR